MEAGILLFKKVVAFACLEKSIYGDGHFNIIVSKIVYFNRQSS